MGQMNLKEPLVKMPTAPVLGSEISLLNMGQTLDLFKQWISERTPRRVITVDATALVLAKEDPEFRTILESAALRTADGVGILWALKRAGVAQPNKVSGVELVEKLVAMSADSGIRLYFLGAAPGVAEMAAERLRLKYPGCNIVGARHGYFGSDSDDLVAAEVAETKPDVLLVAMGMPRQEKFILATQNVIQAPLAMGVGGSFDVFSGKTKRAPKFIQSVHLEWLWRLMLNPTKIAKVKKLPQFAMMVLREKR